MEYEGQICRAPMERSAYKLPVMVGCVYNNCRFCNLFRHLKFRLIPIEEVEADLKRAADTGGSLPHDRDRMLAKLDDMIAEYKEKQDVCAVLGPDDEFVMMSAY